VHSAGMRADQAYEQGRQDGVRGGISRRRTARLRVGLARAGPLLALVSLMVAGCAAPQQTKMGPPPYPILSTRPPRTVPALPHVELPPAPAPEPRPAASLRGATIVVDPGHGGDDPGTLGRGSVPEKTVNLDIGRKVARALRERGANVVMTRTSDRFITLDRRAALADQSQADLFVAIHADSARRSSASGMTVYIARNASGESRRAAQRISAALQRAGFEVRGVQTAGYRVLIGHSRPAVLIECGFLSNYSEARLLSSDSYRSRVAEAIADGVGDHFAR
jgi:N-acetylmuramoyl-L-alanine amidase